MANTDIFTRAKAYRKKHPKTAWTDCVKAVAKKKAAPAKKKAAPKKKTATVGRVKHKKSAPAAPRKIKVKIKPGKKGASSISISGIHLDKTRQELRHQGALVSTLNKHRAALKVKGLTPGEKAQIRRDIASYQKAIKTSKQHVTALKRSI